MERSEIRDATVIETAPDCAALHPGYAAPSSLREAKRRSNPLSPLLWLWIASRSLSAGARSRDPLARNDGIDQRATLPAVITRESG